MESMHLRNPKYGEGHGIFSRWSLMVSFLLWLILLFPLPFPSVSFTVRTTLIGTSPRIIDDGIQSNHVRKKPTNVLHASMTSTACHNNIGYQCITARRGLRKHQRLLLVVSSIPRTRKMIEVATRSTTIYVTNPQSITGDNHIIAPDDNDAKKTKKKLSSSFYVTMWVHVLSAYIVVANYWSICWPSNIILRIPFPVLSFVHAISAMLFSGGIITTTVIEWIVLQNYVRNNNNNNDNHNKSSVGSFFTFWFLNVPKIEQMIVLPAITGSVISGIGQAFLKYGNLKSAPIHIKASFHLFLLFGIWWGITDRRTQRQAQRIITTTSSSTTTDDNTLSSLHPVFFQRRISNVVSCFLVLVLYGIMILKPKSFHM